jgi:hypothetical protein
MAIQHGVALLDDDAISEAEFGRMLSSELTSIRPRPRVETSAPT